MQPDTLPAGDGGMLAETKRTESSTEVAERRVAAATRQRIDDGKRENFAICWAEVVAGSEAAPVPRLIPLVLCRDSLRKPKAPELPDAATAEQKALTAKISPYILFPLLHAKNLDFSDKFSCWHFIFLMLLLRNVLRGSNEDAEEAEGGSGAGDVHESEQQSQQLSAEHEDKLPVVEPLEPLSADRVLRRGNADKLRPTVSEVMLGEQAAMQKVFPLPRDFWASYDFRALRDLKFARLLSASRYPGCGCAMAPRVLAEVKPAASQAQHATSLGISRCGYVMEKIAAMPPVSTVDDFCQFVHSCLQVRARLAMRCVASLLLMLRPRLLLMLQLRLCTYRSCANCSGCWSCTAICLGATCCASVARARSSCTSRWSISSWPTSRPRRRWNASAASRPASPRQKCSRESSVKRAASRRPPLTSTLSAKSSSEW